MKTFAASFVLILLILSQSAFAMGQKPKDEGPKTGPGSKIITIERPAKSGGSASVPGTDITSPEAISGDENTIKA